MANVQITQLPQAQTLTGTESVPIVQNGVTVQTTVGAITSGPALTQTFLTVTNQPSLANSRYFSTDANLTLTDNGPQSTLVIGLNGAITTLNTMSAGIVVKTGSLQFTPRQIQTTGAGITVSNGDGIAGNPTIGLSGLPLILAQATGSGLLSLSSGTSLSPVTITGVANQIGVSNGTGVGGNPTIYIANNPVIPGTEAMQIPSGTTAQRPTVPTNGDMRYNTDSNNFEFYDNSTWISFGSGDGTVTSVSGTVDQINVVNPSIAPVVSLADNPIVPGTNGMTIPAGSTSQRNGADGTLRYNTDTETFEGKANGVWGAIVTGSGVTSVDVSGGTTGLTTSGGPITSAGTITLGGTLSPSNGGTGATSLTGYLKGNGTSAFTASATIPTTDLSGTITNSQLANSSVTYNGVTVALGASGTITAATTAALTVGTGLQLNSGTTFDGSVAKTISIDSTVATLSGSQTLTNKSISGATNTLSNIPNGALDNSSITIGSSSISLGGTLTTIAGLTLTTPTISSILNTGTLTLPISTDTLVGRATTDTLTNKTIDGLTNTLTNIQNSSLANSSITIGTTAISLGSSSLTLGGLTSVEVTQDPATALQLATKQYVDTLVSSGITYHTPVKYEVPNTTGNLTATYNNGTSGVGATLTNAGTQTAFTPDGIIASIGDRILIYNQTNAYENGVYEVTDVGSGSTNWVLTRTTDADSYGLKDPNALGGGDAFFVSSGNTGAGETYVCNTTGTITFGTTPINFVQVSSAQVYSAGTGLTLTNTTFSITNTGVSASTYGSASQVPVFAVNAQGQLTSATNTSIAIAGSQITSGTVGSSYISGSYTGITGVGTLTAGTWNASVIGEAYGGTGQSSYAVGDMIYATGSTTLSKLTIGTNGYVMTSSGTAPQWTQQSSLSVGTATNLAGGTTGAVPYQSGASTTTFLSLGTTNFVLTAGATAPQYVAQSTLSVGAATNVSGGTAGALVYNTGAGATTFLNLGTTNYVLTAGASAPQYVAQSTLSVGSATNATNAANVAVTSSTTNADFYLTFVSATSGNQAEYVNSSIKCNPSTGAITGGISGGTF